MLNLKKDILFISDDEDKNVSCIIIVASVGGVLVLANVVLVAWCVHHKKCRGKDNRGTYSFLVKERIEEEDGNWCDS